MTTLPGETTFLNSLIIVSGGHLTVVPTSTLHDDAIIQAGGTLTVNGQLFSAGSVQVQHGGLLNGSGLIVGNVINSGTVSPGNSPGTLHIQGNYTQTKSGTLVIQIASRSSFD